MGVFLVSLSLFGCLLLKVCCEAWWWVEKI